jgi:Holliday junction resolvase RusA-like endonuclease
MSLSSIRVEPILMLPIAGTPKARPRPRHGARIGKNGKAFSTTYQPKKIVINKKTGKPTPESLAWVRSQEWYDAVKAAFNAHPSKPDKPLEGPLRLDIEVFLDRPAYLDETYANGSYKYPEGPAWCIAKPDRDNLDKGITDPLKEAGLYQDDSQLVAGELRKCYHDRGAGPGVLVYVYRILLGPGLEDLDEHGKPAKTPRPIQCKAKGGA